VKLFFSPSFKSERILARGTFEVKYFTFSAFKTDFKHIRKRFKTEFKFVHNFLSRNCLNRLKHKFKWSRRVGQHPFQVIYQNLEDKLSFKAISAKKYKIKDKMIFVNKNKPLDLKNKPLDLKNNDTKTKVKKNWICGLLQKVLEI